MAKKNHHPVSAEVENNPLYHDTYKLLRCYRDSTYSRRGRRIHCYGSAFSGYYPDYNEGLIKLCQETGCTFIDNSTIVTDSSENLYEPDGEHVIQDYYPKWLTNMAQIAGLKA